MCKNKANHFRFLFLEERDVWFLLAAVRDRRSIDLGRENSLSTYM